MNKEMYDQIYSRDNPSNSAHGSIQWKGTDVCIDLHCKCGKHMHFDGEFFYNFKCPHCDRSYAVGQNIALIELDPDEIEHKKDHVWSDVEKDYD